jgi:hypothetical protein
MSFNALLSIAAKLFVEDFSNAAIFFFPDLFEFGRASKSKSSYACSCSERSHPAGISLVFFFVVVTAVINSINASTSFRCGPILADVVDSIARWVGDRSTEGKQDIVCDSFDSVFLFP